MAVISTIHGAHKVNPNYTYDSLFAFIDRFKPDVIGVEIRPEDVGRPFSYLKKNYPYEMYETIARYKHKHVVGIDWLGDDVEGSEIPDNYWTQQSEVKKLQQKLNSDPATTAKLHVLDSLRAQKNRIALTATLAEINNGIYDSLNTLYYLKLDSVLRDTQYAALPGFYATRDQKIAANIIQTIEANKGKRLLFLVGADHRSFAVKSINSRFNNKLLILPSSAAK